MQLEKDSICSLCGRKLGNILIDKHHLVPKTFGGKDIIILHRICHVYIHRIFSERQLQKYYHTVERILTDEKVQRFVDWVQTKPLDFYISIDDTFQRKAQRRR